MNQRQAEFENDLRRDFRSGKGKKYMARITSERRGLAYANSVSWDRELVIEHYLAGRSGWLGREVFEQSFDDGSMRWMAESYDRVATEFGR